MAAQALCAEELHETKASRTWLMLCPPAPVGYFMTRMKEDRACSSTAGPTIGATRQLPDPLLGPTISADAFAGRR